jgi:tellurite methyltransferase
MSVDKLLGYNACQNETSYYEDVYSSTKEYYWGVKPSRMCLKIVSLMPPDKHLKILDVGCGEGKDAVFLARCGYDVTAFDISDTGVEKTKRLAESASVHVNVFKANICDYRLDNKYDILYSSGVLHYIKPALRNEIFSNYRDHTEINGLNAFNAFVKKPFIASAPENEEHSYLWYSGELLVHYHDWLIEDFSEQIFDCHSSGIPHQHAMNTVYARKK